MIYRYMIYDISIYDISIYDMYIYIYVYIYIYMCVCVSVGEDTHINQVLEKIIPSARSIIPLTRTGDAGNPSGQLQVLLFDVAAGFGGLRISFIRIIGEISLNPSMESL